MPSFYDTPFATGLTGSDFLLGHRVEDAQSIPRSGAIKTPGQAEEQELWVRERILEAHRFIYIARYL